MKRTIVLKRLSASDLTIFENQYRNTPGAKQKGINLDKAVFLGQLYSGLSRRLATGNVKVPLELQIYGPGCAGLHSQQRKILLQAKNIRLNGEFIKNPLNEPGRYDSLEKGDLALMEFLGDESPDVARMVIVSQADSKDAILYNALMQNYGDGFSLRKGMQVLVNPDLTSIVASLSLPAGHPVLDFIDEDDLEDAALGGFQGATKLRQRRGGRCVAPDELKRNKRLAEQNGRLGEELLNAYLSDMVDKRELAGVKWVSDEDAIAPYDFFILDVEDRPIRAIDAKSTGGKFSNPIHVSMAELIEMVRGDLPYDIYRLYGVAEAGARYRVAENVGATLVSVFEAFEGLPAGVRVDGISIDPAYLQFGSEGIIDLQEPDDYEEGEQEELAF